MGRLRIKPVLQAWGRTLRGRVPSLSIEITKECPLRCPGCYAYEDAHLGTTNLRSLSDFKGQELIARVLDVVDQHRPLHLSIVGGDPLVRYRELEVLQKASDNGYGARAYAGLLLVACFSAISAC